MSRKSVAWVLVIAAVLLAGCGGSPTAPDAGAPQLELSVELSSTSIAPGERLSFTVRVVNRGTASGSLSFTSGCVTHFRVSDANGVVFDDAMRIRVCTAEAITVEIAPGESRAWSDFWDQETVSGPAAPGSYRLAVELISAPALTPAEAEFEITS